MPMRSRARWETRSRPRARSIGRPNSESRKTERLAWRPEPRATQRRRMRPRPCKHCAASVRRRKNVSRSSFPMGRQLDAEFLAQGNEPRVVAVFENKRCYHQLSQTGIVGSVSIVEPAEHFIWFFANSVHNGNVVDDVAGVCARELRDRGVSRG